ncbi:MAG TPA: DUF1844 domain-containing protein [Bryobacteraceae bacterium]|nr:DUF1844 domain-containing protein [Bryobacteraceae bacterium]
MSDSELPLPPATFEFLTISLKTQAEIQLGLLHFGDDQDQPEPDLRIARHTIDMLGMLQDKTRGNLSLEEQRLLENSLTELRFRYVQAVEKAAKPEIKTETQESKAEGQAG